MTANSTQHLWLGWLAPSLRFQDDDGITEDVCEFLQGFPVKQVVPERNGARIGAFVLLDKSISKAEFKELSRRLYHGEWPISVDDAQPKFALGGMAPANIAEAGTFVAMQLGTGVVPSLIQRT